MTVLLIDDDVEFCEEVVDILAQEGYAVSVVHDGVRGRDLAAARKFDVILLDFKLPGCDGRKIFTEIKKRDPGQRVVIVSGSVRLPGHVSSPETENGPEEEIHAADESALRRADAVLSKPFAVPDLLTILDTFSLSP